MSDFKKPTLTIIIGVSFILCGCQNPLSTIVSSSVPPSSEQISQNISETLQTTQQSSSEEASSGFTLTTNVPNSDGQSENAENQYNQYIVKHSIEKNTTIDPKIGNSYIVDINYPELMNTENIDAQNKINSQISSWIQTQKAEFSSSDHDCYDPTNTDNCSSTIDYNVSRIDKKIFSIEFDVSEYYLGMAHPLYAIYTYNYDLTTGNILQLSDLFKKNSDYLNFISKYSIKEINQQYDPSNLAQYGMDGVKPTEENFSTFVLTDNTLNILFQEYQVGPYDIGAPSVEIPLADLKEYLVDPGKLEP